MTEMARSKISNRSLKLFTFSGIYHATKILLSQKQASPFAEKLALAVEFWTQVAKNIPDWGRAKRREISPAERAATYVHAHAIALSALARAGRSLSGDRSTTMGPPIGAPQKARLVEIEPTAVGGKGHDRGATL